MPAEAWKRLQKLKPNVVNARERGGQEGIIVGKMHIAAYNYV